MNENNTVVLNSERLLDITESDSDFILDLISDATEETPMLLESLRKAVESGVSYDIQSSAHGLSGAAANFGGERLAQITQELERKARNDDLTTAGVNLVTITSEVSNFIKALQDTDWAALCNK